MEGALSAYEGALWRAGSLSLRTDVDSLAYAIVRMTEGFIYHDAVVGSEPDVERAASIVGLLLE